MNKRKPLTPEHKEKIRASMLKSKLSGVAIGRPKGSAPWNKGIRISQLGYVKTVSEETKRKMSEAKKGKSKTEEHRAKISAALRGRRCSPAGEFKKGMTSWLKGGSPSAEHRMKISKANRGRKMTKEWIKKCLRRSIPTTLEAKFQEIIDKLKLPYRYVGNGEVMIGSKNPDFVNINGEKIAIEVYARYYKLRHCQAGDIERWKTERRDTFREFGWDVIYFDETQVNETYVKKALGGN